MKTIYLTCIAYFVVVCGGATLLAACSDSTTPQSADDAVGTGVKLVTLADGTRCAVAYGGSYARPSGVDCDWSTSPRAEK